MSIGWLKAFVGVGSWLLVAVTMTPVVAQERPVPAPSTKSIELARELIVAMGAAKQLEAVVPAISQQIAMLMKQQQQRYAREIDEVFKLVSQRMLERQGELIGIVAPLYAKRFSESELNEMLGFFKTAVGRKMSEQLPAITQESMQAGMQWGRSLGQELEREVRRELKSRGIDL